MIITKLIGGLGNQLFQYAAGKSLAEFHNVELKLDTSIFNTYKLHNYSLHHFNISAKVASADEIKSFSRFSNRIKDIIFFKPYYRRRMFKEQFFHFDENFMKASSDTMISGYWQSEKYFQEIANIVRQEFSIITPKDDVNKGMSNEISSLNSVSLHIRRGDYISDSKANKVHGACDQSYYENCVNQVVKTLKDPIFYIFSDEPDWVRSNFQLKHPTVYVEHNDSKKNYEDLRLMSLCKYNIIANSSFSWWGAWLNQNPDKYVFAPINWFSASERRDIDLMPNTWLRI